MKVLALIFAAFCYGILTVSYQLPPYKTLQHIKKMIVSKSSIPVRSVYSRHKVSFFDYSGYSADNVMLGDSITDHAEWQELFPAASIANRGVSSDTTAMVVERLDSVISLQPERVFIMLGNNDLSLGLSLRTTHDNYLRIIGQLNSSDIDVVVQSTLLTDIGNIKLNAAISKLNDKLKEFSTSTDKVYFLDLNVVLAPAGYLEARYSLDGVHLNASGYQVWKNQLTKYIN